MVRQVLKNERNGAGINWSREWNMRRVVKARAYLNNVASGTFKAGSSGVVRMSCASKVRTEACP